VMLLPAIARNGLLLKALQDELVSVAIKSLSLNRSALLDKRHVVSPALPATSALIRW